eukprot:TRINITY_DN4488_c0_g2_i2.p1 TRINITY_DN4488_c0_g2~~TRINITY_DN4488_c0_g2_i2.p1  ORF type:complete len:496 (+),score=94.32 TRINITY_DN4488_c0_g2_i2:56-1543(+)
MGKVCSCKICSLTTSFIFLVGGILLLCTSSQIFDYIYNSQLVLQPDSASFPMWRDIPPLQARIYLFNVTNSKDVTEKKAKPKLEEVGPFVFYENHEKTKLHWNPNNTVTYQQIRTWHFAPELSVSDLNTEVTIINPVAASIGDMLVNKIPKLWHLGTEGFLEATKEKVFVTQRVGDILFDGYEDPLLTDMEALKFILKAFIPDGAFMDKFGFFYARNGSDYVDGVFNMFTGQGDNSLMGKVHSWNYSTQNYFPGKCGQVRGGAGEFYPPRLNKTYVELYSNDVCRSLKFEYNSTVYPHGIHSYEYVATKDLFANGTDNPENACYNPTHLPSGVYNTSICRFGAPVFISLPHFYLADPYYGSLVEGMKPEQDKHRTFLRIEPESGVPTQVSAKFQLNVLMQNVSDVKLFQNLPKAFVPVMWYENVAETPHEMVFQMKMISGLEDILGASGWACCGLGIASFLLYAIILLASCRMQHETPILTDSIVEDSDNEVFQD